MLNAFEAGDPWPVELTQARAPFLPKEGSSPDEPLGYRLLFILPSIYRRWASVRQHQLRPWVEEWALPEMFAGVCGR
eukprot:7919257-Lingulodinium_polyedra.AAC.1